MITSASFHSVRYWNGSGTNAFFEYLWYELLLYLGTSENVAILECKKSFVCFFFVFVRMEIFTWPIGCGIK